MTHCVCIEEYSENIDPQLGLAGENQNFLQYWEKEEIEEDDNKEDIQIGGPVGAALAAYVNHSNNQDNDSFVDDEELEHDNAYFSPASDSAEDILRNFEASIAEHHRKMQETNFQNTQVEHQYLNEQDGNDQNDNYSEYETITNPKKRELKLSKKQATDRANNLSGKDIGLGPSNVEFGVGEKSKSTNSGLIIKIRSGNNIIMNETVPCGVEKMRDPTTSGCHQEENKHNGQEISSSTSTMSVDRLEHRARRLSNVTVTSIELENNVKIF